jgi:hypothetical protein
MAYVVGPTAGTEIRVNCRRMEAFQPSQGPGRCLGFAKGRMADLAQAATEDFLRPKRHRSRKGEKGPSPFPQPLYRRLPEGT